MITTYYNLTINFKGYTEECEEVIIGICRKMGMNVCKVKNSTNWILETKDEQSIDYIKYLADCDVLQLSK